MFRRVERRERRVDALEFYDWVKEASGAHPATLLMAERLEKGPKPTS